MDLNDFIPFKNEFSKAFHGITSNATHTSETPVFDELRVRRYSRSLTEISEFIHEKIDRWFGWFLMSEKTTVGGMTTIRAEVSSVLLFGLKISVTFGLFEEKDVSGNPITTVNAKAETQIEAKGDLGESRRVIRMMLGALDFNFKKDQVKEDDYQYRSAQPKGSVEALQQMFNDAPLQHDQKSDGMPKATPIEFKKKPAVQTIQIRPSVTSQTSDLSNIASDKSQENSQDKSFHDAERVVITAEETKPVKPKITIITAKKTI